MADQVSLLTAFAAGIVSFLSPCVLPLVPGYMSFISGVSLDEMRAEDRKSDTSRAVMVNTAFFVLGFTIVFVSLGAAASSVGSFLLENQRWLQRIAGAIVVIFGLHLVGLLKIEWLYRDKRFHGPVTPRGPFGALLLGLAFAAGWTPCIGPILAGILALAATQSSMWQGVLLLAVYSAGLGIPFLLTGLATQRLLDAFQRMRPFMWAIEMAGGILLIAVGIMIFTDNFFLFQRWLSFLNRFAL
jgi:cytochrome c-type biogenesis protein